MLLVNIMTHPIVLFAISIVTALLVTSHIQQQQHHPNHKSNQLRLENVNNKNGAIVEKLLIPRPPGSPNIQRVQQHLLQWYREMGWHEQVQTFTANTPRGPLPMANLIFTQNPRAKERIVLAAHYDSKLVALDGGPVEGVFVGATDSAVPCAMIVELCRALPVPTNDDVTVQAVFFDGEEAIDNWSANDSLYGSRQLAHLWLSNNGNPSLFNLQNMRLFVLLDLLGAARPRIPTYSDTTKKEFKQLVEIEDRLTAAQLIHKHPSTRSIRYFHFIERVGGGLFIQDDHVPFYQRGFRHILHLIPSPFPSVWHRMADDGDAMDGPTIDDLMLILFEFLKLQL